MRYVCSRSAHVVPPPHLLAVSLLTKICGVSGGVMEGGRGQPPHPACLGSTPWRSRWAVPGADIPGSDTSQPLPTCVSPPANMHALPHTRQHAAHSAGWQLRSGSTGQLAAGCVTRSQPEIEFNPMGSPTDSARRVVEVGCLPGSRVAMHWWWQSSQAARSVPGRPGGSHQRARPAYGAMVACQGSDRGHVRRACLRWMGGAMR